MFLYPLNVDFTSRKGFKAYYEVQTPARKRLIIKEF